MRKLRAAWGALFVLGSFLIALDVLANTLVSVSGLPAFGVIGGALVLLVCTSILNWIFKTAWNERSPSSAEPGEPAAD